MEKIGGLFEKFKGKFAKHIHNLSVSIEVIKKYTGITYDIKNISISSTTVAIKGSISLKNFCLSAKITAAHSTNLFVQKDNSLTDAFRSLRIFNRALRFFKILI